MINNKNSPKYRVGSEYQVLDVSSIKTVQNRANGLVFEW